MSISRAAMWRTLAICILFVSLSATASAQTAGPESKPPASASTSEQSSTAPASEMEEVRRLLLKQQEEIARMRATINEQSREIDSLRQRVEQVSAASTQPALITTSQVVTTDTMSSGKPSSSSASKNQPQDIEARVTRVEADVKKTREAIGKQLGSITFSGDIRLRYEAFYGQLNSLANAVNPLIVGNELSARNRFRVRARLQVRGQVGKEFDWGLRFNTGSLADAISSNQTLTDFFNRKPVGLDNAYISYSPARVPGLRLQGGKFDVPWLRTEMTIDNDVTPEGFNETYSRAFKNSKLKNLTFVAWQLPFLERNSAFIRNADGTVNVDESGRGGRDLALYGAQARTRFEFTPETGLTLAVADLYYSGTQFISPIQVFGSNLLIPVSVTIPANGTTPAQTVTTQVSIPRDLLVSGNANLGLSVASNNAVNRDGRLSSGYNLVDVMARLDMYQKSRFPVTLILDFVTNTQVRDVVVAGPGGANLLLPNHENNGYWAELQVGKLAKRGDWLFNYTFMRIEKDAVLTPFNASDINQQSDVRVNRFQINYAADTRVVLSFIAFITDRPNGLLGVFGNTPPGSLNRPTVRLQWDTTFRF
ncbi:MAG: putative porin [Pyrinomonadaceae bacterium]|nr:putative porin [Pyrinomonadaceae bacterium]